MSISCKELCKRNCNVLTANQSPLYHTRSVLMAIAVEFFQTGGTLPVVFSPESHSCINGLK